MGRTMKIIKWVILITFLLLVSFNPVIAQNQNVAIIKTLEKAIHRWMAEGSGKYYIGGDLNQDPEILFSQFKADTTNPCNIYTSEMWTTFDDNQSYLQQRGLIFECTSEEKAVDLFQSYKSQYLAIDAEPFHGFPSQNYSVAETAIPGRMWIAHNLIFATEDSDQVGLTLGEVIKTGKPLGEFIYEEAVKNELISIESEMTEESKRMTDLIVQAALHPNPASIEDREVVFTADIYGQTPAEVNTFTYTWNLDGKTICQLNRAPGECAWMKPTIGQHAIQVVIDSKTSKRAASNAIGFEVIEHREEGVEDPNVIAGFIINYLSCSSGITSDDTLSCMVAFQRTNPDIKELTLVWKVNGYTAATQTRTDNGSVFAMDKPAPGDHSIQVVLTNPKTGLARSQTALVEVFEGKNAHLPPGSQTGAAVGTITGIGTWLWWEYSKRRKVGYHKTAPEKAPEETEVIGREKTETDSEEESGEVDTGQKESEKTKTDSDQTTKVKKAETEVEQKEEQKEQPAKGKEDAVSQEQLKDWYDSARLGDFFLGGNLPEVGNTPNHAPPTWAPDSPLWKGLNPQMTDEELAKFLEDLREKYKVTDIALTGLRAFRAAARTLMTAEQFFGSAWRWAVGSADGEWDIIVPDPVSSYHENLIKNSKVEAELDRLKDMCWDSQTAGENFLYGRKWTKKEAKGLLAEYEKSKDDFNPDDFSNSDDAVEAYDALIEKIKRFEALVKHPEF